MYLHGTSSQVTCTVCTFRMRPATAWRQPLPFWHLTMLPRRWHPRTLLLRGCNCFSPLDGTSWHVIQLHPDIYIYIIIYIHSPGPCFDLCLLLYIVGESCCFLAGVKGIQVKNWICSSWDIRISILHDNILHNCINAYILLYFRKPFHQLCFCPPRMFSSTSALLGLSRSADYSASNANLLLGFASQIVGGQNWLNL